MPLQTTHLFLGSALSDLPTIQRVFQDLTGLRLTVTEDAPAVWPGLPTLRCHVDGHSPIHLVSYTGEPGDYWLEGSPEERDTYLALLQALLTAGAREVKPET